MKISKLYRALAVVFSLLTLGIDAHAQEASQCSNAPGAASAAQFVTLGTGGGPHVQVKRSQPANAVVVGDDIYLFDVGDGALRQLTAAGLSLARVKAIFLSHFHVDHAGGLGSLLVNRWATSQLDPVPVIGPPGTVETVRRLASAFEYTEKVPLGIASPTILDSVMPKDMAPDMNEPELVFEGGAIRVLAIPNDHYHALPGGAAQDSRSYSFRMEACGRSIVYSGDTGSSKNLEKLAQGADLLVSEVFDRVAMERIIRRFSGMGEEAIAGMLKGIGAAHLTPVQVGGIAKRAGVARVVLTHLLPGRDTETNDFGYVKDIATVYDGPVVVASDLDRF